MRTNQREQENDGGQYSKCKVCFWSNIAYSLTPSFFNAYTGERGYLYMEVGGPQG